MRVILPTTTIVKLEDNEVSAMESTIKVLKNLKGLLEGTDDILVVEHGNAEHGNTGVAKFNVQSIRDLIIDLEDIVNNDIYIQAIHKYQSDIYVKENK